MFCCRPFSKRQSFPSPENSLHKPELSEKADTDPLIEKVLCTVDDIPEGGKREFDVNGVKVLVIYDRGHYYGLGAFCAHLRAPLIKGFYHNGSIRCPAHGARYNVETGDIEDFPAFSCLPTYKVRRGTRWLSAQVFAKGSYVLLQSKESALTNWRPEWRFETPEPSVSVMEKPIVVIGTGPSGVTFVETLRKLGCSQQILMLTQEFELPYDRTMLNKKVIHGTSEARTHSEEWYQRMKVEIQTSTKVLHINTKTNSLVLSTSSFLEFSSLFIGMGCAPRRLAVPGAKLANVCYLRSIADSVHLWERARGVDVVCIGGSFIGMEAASTLIEVAHSVTVVCATEEPLPAFGRDIGAALRKYFDKKGIRVITRGRIEYLSGSEMGAVEAVHLVDGEVLPAECVLVGIGVQPDTELLQASGLPVSNKGYLLIDENMKAGANIWAGGDVTQFALPWYDTHDAHIEHFQVAQSHGYIAAHTFMDRLCDKEIVPFFWGRFFNELSIKFSGTMEDATCTEIRGDIANFDFTKYYFKNQAVIGVASCGPANSAVQFLDLFQRKIRVMKHEVEANISNDWDDWRHQTKQ